MSARMDPRTRALLEAPIAATLLRLAAPNVLVMLVQAAVGLVETYFIGKLGTDALAGVALVFPVVMLMQMMSAGAMGGGIASAIARALGGARRGHPRHGQHGVAGLGDLRRRPGRDSALAGAHLRLGTVSGARDRGRRARVHRLLRIGFPGARRLSLVGQERVASVAACDGLSVAT